MLATTSFEIPPSLVEKTKGTKTRMIIAGADTEIVVESVKEAVDAGIITPVIVSNSEAFEPLAEKAGLDIGDIELIESKDEEHTAITAACLAAEGRGDALMKGHIHSDTFMKAVLDRERGLRTDRRMSHIFHMTVPGSDRVLYITDAALNVAPDHKGLVAITQNVIETAQMLGVERPKVALLSATESVTPSMPTSELMYEVAREFQGDEVQADVVGPLAFDNAISPEAAKIKKIEGPVAGNTDIIVVPNIEMGNGIYKCMVYTAHATAAGVVAGAKVPIVLTSRADPPEARLASSMLAALLGN